MPSICHVCLICFYSWINRLNKTSAAGTSPQVHCIQSPMNSSWHLLCLFVVISANMQRIILQTFLSSTDIIVTTNGEPVTSKEIQSCIHLIQELIVVRLNQAVANKLISSVDYLRESFVGTLERCLNSLEKSNFDSSVHNVTSNHLKQVGRSL